MNNLKWTLLIAVLFLSACATMSKDFDPPKIDLVGVKPLNSESAEPRFLIVLRVVNPNDKELAIKGIYYEISAEGHDLFTGASDQASVIPAYGENTVTLTAAPSLFGAIGLFKSLIIGAEKGNVDAINYELYTKISVSGMMVPLRIRHKGKLDLSAGAGNQISI
jgi:LEA14-like dessication related protein